MTQSPLAVARRALDAAAASLPLYSSAKSRHDYTQPQLFAILADSADLRRELGLSKVPHYSTLAYAAARLLKKGASTPSGPPSSPTPALAA
jgi:hypothetical protein